MTDKKKRTPSFTEEFDGYKRMGEPGKIEKSSIWQAAIGLQQTDGLKPSAYLIETAKKNIDGDITFDEVKKRLDSYYATRPVRPEESDRVEEADKVSARIAEILSEKAFTFSPAEYITIHKRLFAGIYKFAGKIRDHNITKAEWVLNGETVHYASADSIRATMDYDFGQEKAFSHKGLTKEQTSEHIARFISGLWQIHAFGEGNTRTAAVFAIKYLREFGFEVTNDMFAEHSWYFRNALVRANYRDHKKGIHPTYEYLNRFFGNLILDENNVLKNREMLVNADEEKNKAQNKAQHSCGDVTLAEAVVMEFLREHPNATQIETATAIDRSRRTVQGAISSLKEKGLIKRDGSKKTGKWVVNG
jgi:fido (protein-threonine AMPylation protein)